MKRKKIVVIVIIAVLAAGGAATAVRMAGKKAAATYETAVVGRATLEETVSSSGKIQAVGTVNVLTQLTGTVEKVLVDFNDTVKKGQPLVELDTQMLKISLRETEASLISARAQYENANLTYENNKTLFARKLISEFDLLTSKTDKEVKRAALIQAETQYEKARLNIDEYAIILSPIDGIVLDRKVEKGDTVVANSGSVTQLFILAANLQTMEIWGNVDELDIANISLGMDVNFTADAYPNKKFKGKVTQVRKVPTTTDNVVNYTVIVTTQNDNGLLLPGMTANMEFLVTEKKNIIAVPSAAFRFTPPDAIVHAAQRKLLEERLKDKPDAEREAALKQFDDSVKTASAAAAAPRPGGGGLLPMPRIAGSGRQGQQNAGAGSSGGGNGVGQGEGGRRALWFLEQDGSLKLRMVKTGISGGQNVELLAADDLEGLSVIVRQK